MHVRYTVLPLKMPDKMTFIGKGNENSFNEVLNDILIEAHSEGNGIFSTI